MIDIRLPQKECNFQKRSSSCLFGTLLRFRRRLFHFRKQAMPFLTVDAIIGNQAYPNGRCHICFSSGLDKVETGYNLLME